MAKIKMAIKIKCSNCEKIKTLQSRSRGAELYYHHDAWTCTCGFCNEGFELSAKIEDAEQCVHTDPPSALVSAANSTNTAGG